MFAAIRKHWRDFKARPPGERFKGIHKARAKRGKGQTVKKWIKLIVGIALTATGLFFLAVPGPGLPILAVGLAMIAGESLTVAKFLDWLEVKLRAIAKQLMQYWRHSTLGKKAALVAIVVLIGSGSAAAVVYFVAIK